MKALRVLQFAIPFAVAVAIGASLRVRFQPDGATAAEVRAAKLEGFYAGCSLKHAIDDEFLDRMEAGVRPAAMTMEEIRERFLAAQGRLLGER